MKKLLFLLLIIPFFAACDPVSGYDYYVENSSAENIAITQKDGLYLPNIYDGKVILKADAGKTVLIGHDSVMGPNNGSDFIGTYEPHNVVTIFKIWVGNEEYPLEITTYSTDWRYRLISKKENKGQYTLMVSQELIDNARKVKEE